MACPRVGYIHQPRDSVDPDYVQSSAGELKAFSAGAASCEQEPGTGAHPVNDVLRSRPVRQLHLPPGCHNVLQFQSLARLKLSEIHRPPFNTRLGECLGRGRSTDNAQEHLLYHSVEVPEEPPRSASVAAEEALRFPREPNEGFHRRRMHRDPP
jgi:hypothetical protein